jgi:hypothetical protein
MPVSEVAMLPGAFEHSCQGTLAYWKLARNGVIAQQDYTPNNIRLLLAVSLPQYRIFTVKAPVKDVGDVTGLKLRSTGGAQDLTLRAIGAVPVRLAPGSKAAYHAAAVLSAGGVVALLDTIREVAAAVGLDEAGALRIYLPLLEQTVANARTLGIERSLTGPATRGDAGTIAAHLAVLRAQAPGTIDVYRALLARDVRLAEQRGALSPDVTERLRTALAPEP